MYTVTEDDLKKSGGKLPTRSKILIKDRIADSMFQQVLLTRPREYSVLADAEPERRLPLRRRWPPRWAGSAWRPAPTSAILVALFEATHGSAPEVRRPGQDQPRLAHPLGRHDARTPRMDRSG